MYLVSLYFDEKTEQKMQSFINQVADKTNNTFMTDGKVPPHITVCEFGTQKEEDAIKLLKNSMTSLRQIEVQFVSVGTFLPYVIYLAPVLDKELLNISLATNLEISKIEDCSISKLYRPFQWMPHATIGKKLSPEEMRLAFEVLQNQFGPFIGTVTKIGLAKTNPYRDISVFELSDR
jgi:2'-5' RNA ligase